jgi:TolB-like protein/DNA-binding winged helix-turn-helix (wHTH) protein
MDALATADAFVFEGFRLDRRGLFRQHETGALVPIPIGSRALEVLGVLVERAGDLVCKDEIMNAVWPATVVESSNLPVQIAALRRLLDNGRADGSCIQTVPGRGYRFAATVTPILEPRSGNGVEELITEEREVLVPAPGQPEVTAPNALSLQRKRLRRANLAALTGVLCLLAAVFTASNWHLPWFSDARSVLRLSIVVLPFTNLSSDPDKQYFADGITEDLTTDLSRISNMFVISANTAFTYRNKPVDAKQIGRELGVHYVLEGSLERSGDQVRVNAQLIDAKTDTHLWADRFDHEAADLFALQNEITGRITNTLKLQVIAAEADRRAELPDALDYIFRGRDLFFGRPPSRENYKKAIALYEQALALDPQSAEAKTFLAGALVNRVIQNLTDTRTVDFVRAEQLIDEALAAAPHIALAHYVKGTALRAKGQWEDAVAEFETARSLDRNMAGALQGLGWCKLFTGSLDEVIPLAEEAIRLSPRDPHIGFRYYTIGHVYQLQSRTKEAIVWFEKARGTISAVSGLWAHLASAHALAGDTDLAVAQLAEARRLNGDVYSSIASLKASQPWGVPKIQALFEATYFAGLRKAGMPED